jgi:hypothetical protein
MIAAAVAEIVLSRLRGRAAFRRAPPSITRSGRERQTITERPP